TRPSPIADVPSPTPDPRAEEPGPHEAAGTSRNDPPEPRGSLSGILLSVLILVAILGWAASGPRVAADATLPTGNPIAIGSPASPPSNHQAAPIDAVPPPGRIPAIAPIDSTGPMVGSPGRSAAPAEEQNSRNEPGSAVFDDPGLPDERSSVCPASSGHLIGADTPAYNSG